MSRVEGLAEIVLWVADMEAALQFYRDQFGLEIMSPPELPNKFLMVAKPGGIPEMIVSTGRSSCTPCNVPAANEFRPRAVPSDWSWERRIPLACSRTGTKSR
ncbi:MAG: hypothetical protein E6J46_13585 [Chloroflexi bacterium]|nr:MAG: hypothetical protein E6J46_13585 [Chloroflexota bacterium]